MSFILTVGLIEPFVFGVIEDVLKDKVYNESLVQIWIDEICSKISKDLIERRGRLKFGGGG